MNKNEAIDILKREYEKENLENFKGKKGEPGEDGKNYILTEEDKKEMVGKIELPIVEKIIEKTEVIREQPIITEITKITNEVKEVAKYESGEKIVDKINELPLKPEFQIDASHIKNLPQPETTLGGRGKQISGAGGSEIKDYDLSSYLDGVTKVFTVPSNKRFISLIGTQFPIVYRKTTDYTGSGTPTLTLTDTVSAPSNGQTLIFTYAELCPKN